MSHQAGLKRVLQGKIYESESISKTPETSIIWWHHRQWKATAGSRSGGRTCVWFSGSSPTQQRLWLLSASSTLLSASSVLTTDSRLRRVGVFFTSSSLFSSSQQQMKRRTFFPSASIIKIHGIKAEAASRGSLMWNIGLNWRRSLCSSWLFSQHLRHLTAIVLRPGCLAMHARPWTFIAFR